MSALTGERRAESRSQQGRRYELDWLRVLAVFGLIPFHVAIIYSLGPKDYVASAQSSPVLDLLAVFVTFWGIPLLFLVGGASAWFALGARSPKKYLRERISRLLIPFLVGVLTVVPIQVYFGRLGDPEFHQSFVQFYLRYWLAFTTDQAPQYWAHLWFIPCLLVFSLITVPLFSFLRSEAGRHLIAHLATWCDHPGVILLFGLPLGISELLLNAKPVTTLLTTYLLYSNWALFIFFLIFFVYGYLLYADPRFMRAIRRHGPISLMLGLVFWLTVQLLLTAFVRQPPGQSSYDFTVDYVAAMFLRGFISWCWIVALLSLALYWLTFTNGLLRYLNEAFYPVYVLHMTVLTIIGFFVVQWPTNVWVQYVVIVVATLLVTLAIYDVAIRRNNVARYLFGLKPKKAIKGGAQAVGGRTSPERDVTGGTSHTGSAECSG